MLGIKPYIAFADGRCEEAFNFYAGCLNGSIGGIFRYGDSPMAVEGINDKVMHATVTIGEATIMGCDAIGNHVLTIGNNISLALGSDDVAAAEAMFDKMAEGGKVTMPMQETFWALRFGMLTDKFGVNWMFNCEKQRG